MSGPRDEIEPRPAVVSDVWHECGNCGGRSPCEESDARDATIERLTRERDAAQAHRAIAVRERDIALHSNEALIARLTDALDARDRAVREYLAAESAVSDALADDSDACNPVAMLARMHDVRTRRDETLARLRALVVPCGR